MMRPALALAAVAALFLAYVSPVELSLYNEPLGYWVASHVLAGLIGAGLALAALVAVAYWHSGRMRGR